MSVALAGALIALAVPAPSQSHPCPKLFTVQMAQRAAQRIYAGPVTPKDKRLLRRLLTCQRNPHAQWFVRWYYQHMKKESRPHNGPEIASWYDDSGQTASGMHLTYGFASLMFGSEWGRRVSFCVAGRNGCAGPTVVGHLDDHGPYVGGRGFDLDPELKAALGCSDLCAVYWR